VAELDPRLITVSIDIGGQLKKFNQDFGIAAHGEKFANPLQNEATVKIANLTRSDMDYLLTETSPFNKNRSSKKIIIEAGRVSTGTSKIYEGNISTCVPSEPPDVWLEFKCQTGQFLKGKLVASNQPSQTKLSAIAALIASQTGLNLNFQATDKNISNYSFNGGALKQVDKLGSMGAVSAYVDDGQLVIKDLHLPLKGQIRILDKDSGMVGIPCATEFGVKVKYLLDKQTVLGGALEIKSVMYPAMNGKYVIYKLGFEIASRDTPFYWDAEGIRVTDSGQVEIASKVTKQKKKPKHK
jgi:hypothetical protein